MGTRHRGACITIGSLNRELYMCTPFIFYTCLYICNFCKCMSNMDMLSRSPETAVDIARSGHLI
eukprot:2134893-Karenia_brevis.AAC.1